MNKTKTTIHLHSNRLSRIVSVIMLLILPFTVSSAGLTGVAYANGAPMNGDGSLGNPYQITECAQFENLAGGFSYTLLNDVDCSSVSNYAPNTSFDNATLDGHNHTIRNLIVSDKNGGLFGDLNNDTIMNLHFNGGSITNTSSGEVGTLGADATNTTITNISSNLSLSGPYRTGGVVSTLADGASSISQSSFSGTIAGNNRGGGIAAESYGSISDSYSTGSISIEGEAGGIVAMLYGSDTMFNQNAVGSIERSYSTMDVASTNGTSGGLVGIASGAALIYDSYATGTTSSPNPPGALIGTLQYNSNNPISLAHDAIDTINAPINTTPQCIGSDGGDTDAATHCDVLDDSNFVNTRYSDIYSDWDFNNVWQVTDGYPSLIVAQDVLTAPTITSITTNYSSIVLQVSSANDDPNAPALSDYAVQYRVHGTSTWSTFNHPATTSTMLRVTGLSGNTSYDVQAAAVNAVGTSDYSVIATASTTTTSGTYLIASCQDLQNMQDDLAGTYTLAGDINCTNYNNFMPIGTGNAPFTGSLQGDGHKIIGLTINDANSDNIGLFSSTQNATIADISLTNIAINGFNNVGAIAGIMSGGSLTQVFVGGIVNGSGSIAGGVVGNATNGADLSQVRSAGSVTGTFAVGGIVGYGSNTQVADSYNTSTITGSVGSAVGGIAGTLDNGSIRRSYNSGMIVGDQYDATTLGGIAGYVTGSSSVTKSVSIGKVTGNFNGTPEDKGELVGGLDAGSSVSNSTWYSSNTDVTTPVGATYGTTVNLTNASDPASLYGPTLNAAYTAWDFSSVWATSATMPTLRAFPIVSISTCQDLQDMQNDLFAHYVLTNDIDCSVSATWHQHSGTGLYPIGLAYGYSGFQGILDGNGHTISHLTINGGSHYTAALFSTVTDATIKNLTLTDLTVNGNEQNAALFITGSGVTVANVHVTGTVSEAWDSPNATNGGLAASLDGNTAHPSSIFQSSFDGTVTGGNYTGGLVGRFTSDGNAANNTISESYFNGTITGTGNVGGIAGQMINATITNSYARAAITGQGSVGGIAGAQIFDSVITNSYVSGSINGINSIGGILGFEENASQAVITHNFIAASVSGDGSNPGSVGIFAGYDADSSMSFNYVAGNYVDSTNYNGYCIGQNSSNDPFSTICAAPSIYLVAPSTFTSDAVRTIMPDWDFDTVWQTNICDYPTLRAQPLLQPIVVPPVVVGPVSIAGITSLTAIQNVVYKSTKTQTTALADSSASASVTASDTTTTAPQTVAESTLATPSTDVIEPPQTTASSPTNSQPSPTSRFFGGLTNHVIILFDTVVLLLLVLVARRRPHKQFK